MPLSAFVHRGALLAAALAVAALAGAATPPAPVVAVHAEAPKADARADIAHRLDVPVEAVRPSAIAGLYEVAHGGEVVYVSTDGHYVIAGDLYDSDKGRNLTAVRRAEARADVLKSVADEDAIIFAPQQTKYTLTVFTDVDCQYCRKLHADIAEYNRLGVRIRYVFYPRSGPNTDSWRKAESVWCSANRQEALTRAKQGAEVAVAKAASCHTPVARTYALGQELGMRGTPGIFTEHGDYVAGYMPPAQLLEKLKQLEAGGPG
jgi:thiol:disulfide interchange protein DsbC